MNISIVIFCYNEAGNIERLVRSCFEFLPQYADTYEIIVVDDGSDDGTADILCKLYMDMRSLKIITHPVNKGIGMALRSGYSAASKEYICAIPGDGQFDIHDLSMVKPFSNHFFCSFYRPKTNYNFYRQFLSISNKLFNQVILGIKLRDVNWIKVYRREQIDRIDLRLKSSIMESEISAKLIKSGCKPIEISSVYHPRESGESKGGSWKTLSKVISELWSLAKTVYAFKPVSF